MTNLGKDPAPTDANSNEISADAARAGNDAQPGPNVAGDAGTTPSPPDAGSPTGKLVVYVGTADETLTPYDVDDATGALAPRTRVKPGKNPMYLLPWKGKRLYVALDGEASLLAFDIDPKSGALSSLGGARGEENGLVGNVPVAIAIDGKDRFAVTGDYGGTTTLYPLDAGGKPGKGTPIASGGNTHDVGVVGDGFVYSGSMGAKRVNQYRYDAAKKKLAANDPATVGDGKCAARGMTTHPNGRLVLVMCHTPVQLMSYVVDAATGALRAADEGESAVPPNTNTNGTSGAEVQLHPNGRVAYGTVVDGGGPNNFITVFSVDPGTGVLTAKAYTKAGGSTPRGIALDPAGKFLFSANQSGNSVTVFDVAADGTLNPKKTTSVGPGPIGLAAIRLP